MIDFRDRMDGLVAAVHKGRLDRDEHELAVQLALMRFGVRLAETFEGTSMGELVNATRTLAFGVCVDVQRRSITHRERFGVSLDEIREGLEGERPSAHWAEAEEAMWASRRAEEQSDARELVAWALSRLGERERRVLEATLQGAPISEIMEDLDVSQANAYQLRSRALRALRGLAEGSAA